MAAEWMREETWTDAAGVEYMVVTNGAFKARFVKREGPALQVVSSHHGELAYQDALRAFNDVVINEVHR